MNGDLRVAYRASAEGQRDMVVVPNWFTNCEVFPELPSNADPLDVVVAIPHSAVVDLRRYGDFVVVS
jgi:hypothetical protein